MITNEDQIRDLLDGSQLTLPELDGLLGAVARRGVSFAEIAVLYVDHKCQIMPELLAYRLRENPDLDVDGVSHMTSVVTRAQLAAMLRSSAEGADADIVEMCDRLCVAVLDTTTPGMPVVVGYNNGATVAWAQYAVASAAGGEA